MESENECYYLELVEDFKRADIGIISFYVLTAFEGDTFILKREYV